MKIFIIIVLLMKVGMVFGQKLDKTSRRELSQILDSISSFDQKYRWELMLGELDVKKLDSLKKLPKTAFWTEFKKQAGMT